MRAQLRAALTAALIVGLGAAETARAAGEPDCTGQSFVMPGFAPAEVVDKPLPRYPRMAIDEWSEGWVLFEYEVTATGEPRAITVIDALGPKDFVRVATEAVARWRYKPATRNGTPVEQYLERASLLFTFEDSRRQAEHTDYVRKFNTAARHAKEGRPDEAIALLEPAFQRRLNLYELSMGSFVLALAYAQKNNWEKAALHISHSTMENGKYLPKSIRGHARALEVEMHARTGNFFIAVCGFAELKKTDPEFAPPDGGLAKMVGGIQAALRKPDPIAVDAHLTSNPLIDAPGMWHHQLLRSKFWFAEMKGQVKSFRLACTATSHQADIDPDMIWNVPAQAGPCILRVTGEPGSTFKLVEEW
jgi:TonB family protein